MKVNILPFALVLLTVSSVANAQEEISPETLRFIGGGYTKMAQEANTLSRDEKLRRISEVKALALKYPSGKQAYTEVLGFLGDEEAIQSLVAEFLKDDSTGPGVLGRMQNPRIIEVVAPAFFGEEVRTYPVGDVFFIPPSYRAAELTVVILGNSPAFSVAVNEWASGLKGLTTSEKRALIRPWWRDNQRLFAERNYKAVQPGPERPRNPYASDPLRAVAPGHVEAVVATTPLPVTSTPPRSASDAQTPRKDWLWLGTIAGSAFVACLFWFWRRLNRERRGRP